jgi:large subunit ribosomal protein L16
MLFPIKVKYKKVQKNRTFGVDTNVYNPRLGFYGIKSIIMGRITSHQIECIRKIILRKIQQLKSTGRIILRIFPFVPITSKPAETRMGKGKGSFSYWCFPVKSGRLLVEFQGVSYSKAIDIYKLVNSKLSFRTKLVRNI